LYEFSLAVHVAAAVIGFGSTFTYPVIQIVAERRDPRALPFAMAAILAISSFVAVPATAVVGVTGIYQLASGPYGLEDAWAATGLALYVAIMLVAVLYLAPCYRRAEREAQRMVAGVGADEAVVLSPAYRAATRRTAIVGSGVGTAVLATVVLMELKPG
jgi:uncharacterized membrane protein